MTNKMIFGIVLIIQAALLIHLYFSFLKYGVTIASVWGLGAALVGTGFLASCDLSFSKKVTKNEIQS